MRRVLPALAVAAAIVTGCKAEPKVKTFVNTVVPPPDASATAAAVAGPSAAELFTQACVTRKAQPAPTVQPTVQYPADALLLSAFPRDLLLDENAVAGAREVTDGSQVTAQWNRNWNRDGSPSGLATRVTNNISLFLTIDEALKQFDSIASGDGGRKVLEGLLTIRGADPAGMCITPIDLGNLGVDQQAGWRAEYLRGNETYITYWAYVRVRNVRATISTFVQSTGVAEQPAHLAEMRQLAAKQAAKLKAQPATVRPEDVKLQDP